MTYQVLARKWRPQAFDAVVGQDHVTRTVRNALESGKVAHAYLFTGPRGVGKTTTARLLAKALACTERKGPEACGTCGACRDFGSGAPVDVMEIDAASNTSVDDIRTLRENVKYAPARSRYKVYIVDEVHMLSGAAFNAFLKTLEEPPAHVVFVLATTEPRKIPATVLSRCQRFDFRPIPPELMVQTLGEILAVEQVPFEPSALPMLVRAAEGSLRDALSLTDTAVAYGEGKLDEASVARLLGSSAPAQVRAFVQALIGRDGAAALGTVDSAATAGEDLAVLARDAVELLRRLLVLKVGPGIVFGDLTPAEAAELTRQAEGVSADELMYLLRAFIEADGEMRRSPHPRVELEVAVVRATRRPAPQALDTLLAKVEEALGRLEAAPAAAVGARAGAVQETLLGTSVSGATGLGAAHRVADAGGERPVSPASPGGRGAPGTSPAPARPTWGSGPAPAAPVPVGPASVVPDPPLAAAAAPAATPAPASPRDATGPGATAGKSPGPSPRGSARGGRAEAPASPPTAGDGGATSAAAPSRPAGAPRQPGAPEPGASREPGAPREAAAPSADRAPAPVEQPSEDALGAGWSRVVEDVMRQRALLGTVLQHASPVGVDGGVLSISIAGNQFHKEMLGDRGNRELINQAVQRHVAGASRLEIDGSGAAQSGARNHPTVQAAVEAFQGEIVAVRPRTPGEGESA